MAVDVPGWGGSVTLGQPLEGSGWAVALQPIRAIVVHCGGLPVAEARLGLPRPDVGSAFPAYPHADRAGFGFTLTIADRPPGPGELRFVLHTADGQTHNHALAVEFRAPAPSRRTPAPPPALGETPPIVLAVDAAAIDARSILRLRGWAVSQARLDRIEALIEGELVGPAFHGEAREDVAAAHGEYPNAARSGFTLVRRVELGDRRPAVIVVRATDAAGVRRSIEAPLTLAEIGTLKRIEDRRIRANCDAARLTADGALAVFGWAVAHGGIAEIAVSLDDATLGTATLGRERPDVGNHHPTIAGAEAGGFAFHGSCPATGEGAEHVLRVSIRSKAGETTELHQRLRAEPAPASIALPAAAEIATAAASPASPAKPAEPASDAIRLAIDSPALTDGAARAPVRGMLAIAGWALARDGIDRIEVQLDDTPLGVAYYGNRREDVAAAFPDWPGAITAGFGLSVPPKLLADGAHVVCVTAIDTQGGRRTASFPITVESADEQVAALLLRRRVARAEIDLHTATLARLGWSPVFCVAVRLVGGRAEEIARLGRTLRSLHAQAWPHWQAVVLAPDGLAPERLPGRIAAEEPELAARVRVLAEAGERPLAALPGLDDAERPGFLCVLRAGDLLGPDALLEAALASGLDRGADLLYGDERRHEPVSSKMAPFFKPDWSPDLLLSTNYIGRPWFAAAGLVARAGLTVPELRRQGEWDAVLRLSEQAGGIRHIRRLLAERYEIEPDTVAQERAALKRAIARRRIAGRVEPGCLPHVHRLRRTVNTIGLVSIIIPTRASRGLIKTTIETIRANTRYPRIEIVAIDNIPETERRWKRWLHQHADTIVAIDEAFNWSRFNNCAAAAAKGEFLLFLNDDVEVSDPEWLDALLEHGQRPEVGVVGPQLLYPDGKVQHAGLFLSDTKGRHAFRFADADDPGPFGLARTQRNMIAVTGACFLVSRANFDALGGFDENHTVVNNDLDFCLRAVARGLAVVFTPHTRLIHHELASRAHLPDQFDTSRFDAAWRTRLLLGDPFHNPRLARDRDDYAPEPEPAQVVHGAHPLLDHARVRRILAVKVDHIGDFVTALPAFRRLKQHFPNARLDVLAASAANSLAALEPAIDRIVEFNFYHARSALGRREVGETELQVLAAQLEPAHYDIAIDLRKHMDTRTVLQYTGARVLAGFDRGGAAPWLDVAIEWEGDTMCVPKRTHVVDDMLRLVDALALACEPDRGGAPARADAAARAAARHLPALAALPEALLGRRLVALHPASGNPMRQWPPVRFAELIDLLVRLDDVTVLLIGAPEEAELAETVLAQASEREAVASLVGRVALRDLPTLLRGCDLYVGNNSGPKHIAAALGVPTVGVHSGVVDAQEWAPVGPAAIAVRREMSCMPCYLEKPESCTRQMACVWGLRAAEVHAACRRMLALAGPSCTVTQTGA